MMNIKYQDKIPDKILSRGYDYYQNGSVSNIHKKDDVIVAEVTGTKTYKCFVQIQNSELISTGCSCPYAEQGQYCKHIAALLYYLEKNDLPEQSTPYQTKKEELYRIIKKIDQDELEKFLVDLLENNESIRDSFRLKFSNLFPNLSLAEYQKRIYNAIRTSGGRDGFIDYEESWNYVHEMYKITNEADRLVDRGYYELAFDIVANILNTIPNTGIDDSNGSTGDVADSCIKIIQEILNHILEEDKTLSKKILQYILNELKTEYLSNYGIELYELLNDYIKKEIYLKEIASSLQSILKTSKTKKYFWYTIKFIEFLIDIYNKENDHSKVINLLEEYSYDEKTCLKLLEEYIKQNEVKKAITVLKQNLEKTNKKFFAEKLSEMYYKESMTKEYKEILYHLLYDLDKYNITIYKKIKNLYSKEDWITERQNIINKILKEKNIYFKDIINIYIEEEMIDSIFEMIKDMNIDTIITYEKHLLPKYNQELMSIYIEYCKKFANNANNRKLYRNLASYLIHIKNMENSKKEYQQLMSEISLQYRNKPAMQDELRGL